MDARTLLGGQNLAWLMNGAAVFSSAFLTPIADTNWEMNGFAIRSATFLPTIADINWEIARP